MRLQNDDGGFAFWRRGDPSWPYLSVHVAHALVRAKDKGFAVPAPMLERAQAYLRDIERHIPRDYGPAIRRTIMAYALYVRAVMGDRDPAKARALFRDAGVEKLSIEAARLAAAAAGRRRRRRRASATSRTASPRPRPPRTSRPPTASRRTCSSTPTGASTP